MQKDLNTIPLEHGRKSFPHKGVHTIFEEQARCRPSQIAVVHGGKQVTYGDLNMRANHLAWYLLRTLNIGQGEIIAICLDRSIECIAALLAIAKLGYASLLIDPSWLKTAKAFQLEDARVRCILTLPQFAADLSARQMLVYLDDDWARVTALQNEMNPPCSCSQLLYIMYTLQNTDTPKRVSIPHREVIRLVCNTSDMMIREDDRIAHLSHLSFDASTFEIWAALLNGACLVIFSRDEILNPEQFRDALHTCCITKLFLTMRLFRLYVHRVPEIFSTVEDLLFGSEKASIAGEAALASPAFTNHLANALPLDVQLIAQRTLLHSESRNLSIDLQDDQ